MVQDEVVIGSLRAPLQRLQELMQYLEARHGLGASDVVYCRERLKEAGRQIKALQQLLDRRLPPSALTGPLFWN